MNADELRRLAALMPTVHNVLGFYGLLYEQGDRPPGQRMIWEAHFATSAHQLAVELHSILNAIADRTTDPTA